MSPPTRPDIEALTRLLTTKRADERYDAIRTQPSEADRLEQAIEYIEYLEQVIRAAIIRLEADGPTSALRKLASTRRACAKCGIELRVLKNEVYVLEMADFGPYKLWQCDKWGCPQCRMEELSGFGQQPLAEHFQPEFKDIVDFYRKRGPFIEVR